MVLFSRNGSNLLGFIKEVRCTVVCRVRHGAAKARQRFGPANRELNDRMSYGEISESIDRLKVPRHNCRTGTVRIPRLGLALSLVTLSSDLMTLVRTAIQRTLKSSACHDAGAVAASMRFPSG